MAIWRNLAKRLPRFSVGSLMIVTASFAIGMMVGIVPTREPPPIHTYRAPDYFDWSYALLSMAACLLCVELWRQQRLLGSISIPIDGEGMRTGRKWAINSRRMLLLLLATLIVATLLRRHNPNLFPEREDFNFFLPEWVFPCLCLNVIFLASLFTIAPTPRARRIESISRLLICVLVWISAAIVAVLVTVNNSFTNYLIHLATANIELSRAIRLHRVGAFPSPPQEGWWNLSLVLVASAALFVAAVAYTRLLLVNARVRDRCLCVSIFLLCLAIAIFYTSWFFGIELHRLSPDFASEFGTAAVARNWFGAIIIFGIVSLGSAIRLSRVKRDPSPLNGAEGRTEIRTGGIVLLALVPLILLALAPLTLEIARFLIDKLQMGLVWTYIPGALSEEVLAEWIVDPERLLQLATSLLALQIAWRWLRRGAPEIVIQPMEPRRVFWTWLGLVALVIVGVPVIAAFGFCWWLGPWYL